MLIFMVSQVGICQNFKIDSLKSLLEIKSGVEYSDLLYELAYELIDIDDSLGLQYAKKAFETAKKNGDSLRIVKAGRIKALAFRRLGEVDSSLMLTIQIIPVAKRHNYNDELKSILNGLGIAYLAMAHYDKALKSFFESLDFRLRDGDKSEISVSLDNIGIVYYKLKDYENALAYFKQSLQLKEEASDKYNLDVTLINISLCYAYKNNFKAAREFVAQGIASCSKNCSESLLKFAQFSSGIISYREQRFDEAEASFLKSYSLAIKLSDPRFQLDNIIYLLKIYISRNQIKLAESYLDKAQALITSGTPYNLEVIKVYSQLIALYAKSRNFERVAFYQDKYIALKDSIYTETLTTNLMKVEAEHLEKENKAKIDSQNKILTLNIEVIARQKFLNVFIGIIAILLVALAIILIKNNKEKRMANMMLDKKVKERTQELELNRDALQRACEARDILLHKTSADITNSLATLKGLCLVGLKDVDEPRARQYLDKMDTTADNFSVILRNLHLTRLEF
jgi:tetratricopeptide (TPR) repeat protein